MWPLGAGILAPGVCLSGACRPQVMHIWVPGLLCGHTSAQPSRASVGVPGLPLGPPAGSLGRRCWCACWPAAGHCSWLREAGRGVGVSATLAVALFWLSQAQHIQPPCTTRFVPRALGEPSTHLPESVKAAEPSVSVFLTCQPLEEERQCSQHWRLRARNSPFSHSSSASPPSRVGGLSPA